ncbi:MAG: hypothetical protein O3C39_08005 [Planctomycetota bacterium]|nr:hypothetical protein [Planctomycetota bacterium]
MRRSCIPLLLLLLPVTLWTAAAGQDSPAGSTAARQPVAPTVVRERTPELYYIENDAGRLVPVPGFRYRDFMELFRIKEGLGGPALPPPAVLESVVVAVDARAAAAGIRACPVTVECRVRQARGGWAMVPLALGQILLDGQPRHEGPGRMLLDADPDGSGYRCWFEPPADAAADVDHTVRLSGRIPVEVAARQEFFTLSFPAAVASRLEIRSWRRQPRVTLAPANSGEIEVVADTTDVADRLPEATGPEGGREDDVAAAGSRIVIAGVAGDVRIRVAEAAGSVAAPAVPEAACESTVQIDGRTAVIAATLSLANLPPGPARLSIGMPPRASLRRLEGDATLVAEPGNVARADGTPVAIDLAVGSDGSATVELECEQPVDPSGGTPVDPLGFAVAGFEPWRQRGRVVLSVDGDWQAAWEDGPGIRRVDPPAGEPAPGLVAAFAYDALPASLPLRIRPRRSRVVVEPEYRYEVSAGRVGLEARLRVAARGAAVGSISLAIEPGWTLGDVGPAGIVDAAAVVVDGPRIVIPFAQPLAGEAVVEIEAASQIAPNAATVSWTMPVPRADLVGPAAGIITSDSNIELVPDADASSGLIRQTASAVQADDSDRIPLVYRLDGAEGRFTANRRFLPRRVEVVSGAEVTLDEREAAVGESLRLDVLHLPLEVIELDVPAEVAASGTLEIRQDGELLDAVEIDARDGGDGEGGPLVRMQAVLREPLLGRGEVEVGYRVAMPEIPPEATAAIDVPLLLPIAADAIRQTVRIADAPALSVVVRDGAWRQEAAGQADEGRLWSAGRPRHSLPLAVSVRSREAVGMTVIEATWLRTRLFPDRREDTACYVVTPASSEFEIRLPEATKAASLDMRVDGERIIPRSRGDGWFVLQVAEGRGRRLVEVRTVAAWGGRWAGLGLPWPLPLEAAAFADDVLQRRFVWEVAVLPEDHLMDLPAHWTSQQAWNWTGLGWERQAVVSSAELAGWIDASLGREEIEAIGSEWPARQQRSVYTGIGSPGGGVAWVVPTWCIVLAVSGLVLAAGLWLVSTAAWQRPGVTIGTLTGLGLAAAAFPSLVPLVGQAAVPGLVLVGVAAGLQRLTATRAALDRPAEGDSASSLTRTAAPTVSLIVAASNPPGSTATAGRDAS